jgi:hypothetical protein
MSDRACCWFLFLCALLVYAWFFQGYGYNQDAHFDTVRALVERGRFEITDYVTLPSPGNTGDISQIGGRTYSSKPPGLPVACVPLYALARGAERLFGLSSDQPTVLQFNLYLLTLWGSALPAALLVMGMFSFLRQKLEQEDAMIFAAALAFGSMLLPYSGVLMVHVAIAAGLFFAWRLLEREEKLCGHVLLAGALVGIAITFDLSIAPVAGLFLVLFVPRRAPAVGAFCIGPVIAVGLIMLYHWMVFGNPLSTSLEHQTDFYQNTHLFLGHFDWPDPRRLYWLSFHPLRGIFYLTPMLLLPVGALLVVPWSAAGIRRAALPLSIIGYFLLLNLTFNGWTGGFGAGPRYLIPAVPFMWVFAPAAYARFRRLGGVLIGISIFNMFVVTAVKGLFPANTFGPPVNENPVAECLKRLTMRQIARSLGSFNIGLLLGLPPWLSLVPPALLIVLVFAIAHYARARRANSLPLCSKLSN